MSVLACFILKEIFIVLLVPAISVGEVVASFERVLPSVSLGQGSSLDKLLAMH